MMRFKDRIRKMEDKLDEYNLHPDNQSEDKEVREGMRNKQEQMLEEIGKLDERMNKQDEIIVKLKKDKDTAFDMIRDIKITASNLTDEIQEHASLILTNRNNITNLQQSVTTTNQEYKRLASIVETHSIKLNASNALPSNKPWMLQSDTQKYPILCAYQSNFNFAKYSQMLAQVQLQGESIIEVKQFYENIDVAIMTSLSVMKFFHAIKI